MVVEKIKNLATIYLIPDDPKTFRTDYIDNSIDRERKPVKTSKWDKYNFLNAFNWYPSHYSAYERKFLLKVDISILLFLSFSFYTKYLDNSNVSTAYVAGLKEDLNLHGNELNYFSTCYTVGYAAFQIPTTLLITKPQWGRHLLLFCELAWGFMTLANAFVRNAQEMYVVRFFVGVFEACSFPVTYVILSSYLTPEELYKRCGFYGAWAVAGTASAGALQTSAMNHLDGVNGLAGWRWQYIIDSVLTFGIVIYGFFLFPGTPTSCKKFGLFSEDDMTFSRKRLEKQVNIPDKWTWKSLKETLTTWQIYACSLLWILHHKMWYASGDVLYMKTLVPEKFASSSVVTTFDSYINSVGIPFALIIPPLCAYYGMFVTSNLTYLTAYYAAIILVIWDVPFKVLMSSFFMEQPFTAGLAQIFFAWFAVLCRDNVEKKAIVLSFAQAASYAVNAFSIPLQYNVEYSPNFKKGYIANLIILVCSQIVFFIILFLEKYDKKYFPKFAGNRDEFDAGSLSDVSLEDEDYKRDAKQTTYQISVNSEAGSA